MLFALAQLPLLWADQRPFTAPADGKLVSDATVEYIEALRGRWGVAGLSIAVVATPESKWGGGEWRNDTLPFGTANAAGDPVTRDVSDCRVLADTRHSSRSRVTRSCTPRSRSGC